ncbi:hypothetical protein [Micromonospora thermarum]|uniref:Uncharacterized protein n=1 Tax=Micromonospora thermarum TaxID=2720024 RepID=A0ABX0Z0P6_9ACTN|nr:hypothetical protein [Micromonospora thermarum]NJP31345.1 hypothetical protein [Micromonospora thermarum]
MRDRADDRLDGEFVAYRDTLRAVVRPAGPDAVREAVRQRRRRRATVLAAAVAVLTATVPLAAWRQLSRDAPDTPVAVGPAASDASTESADPTGSPPGRLSREELLATTVDLPDWPAGTPCAPGPTRLVDPPGRPGDVILSTFAGGYGDIDRDGVAEPVALLRCLVDEGMYPEQVVVLDRTTDGRIVVLGQVFRSDPDRPEWLYALDVRPDGLIRIEVTDAVHSDGEVPGRAHRQWRSYRWDGTAFPQVSGPTRFPGARD